MDIVTTPGLRTLFGRLYERIQRLMHTWQWDFSLLAYMVKFYTLNRPLIVAQTPHSDWTYWYDTYWPKKSWFWWGIRLFLYWIWMSLSYLHRWEKTNVLTDFAGAVIYGRNSSMTFTLAMTSVFCVKFYLISVDSGLRCGDRLALIVRRRLDPPQFGPTATHRPPTSTTARRYYFVVSGTE